MTKYISTFLSHDTHEVLYSNQFEGDENMAPMERAMDCYYFWQTHKNNPCPPDSFKVGWWTGFEVDSSFASVGKHVVLISLIMPPQGEPVILIHTPLELGEVTMYHFLSLPFVLIAQLVKGIFWIPALLVAAVWEGLKSGWNMEFFD